MNIGKMGLIGALAAILATSAAAQTTQTSPTRPTPSVTVPGTSARPAPAATSALVDINSASEQALDTLPGIGKARAAAIIKGRPYKGKDDLLNKHILQPNVYDGIKGKIIAKQS